MRAEGGGPGAKDVLGLIKRAFRASPLPPIEKFAHWMPSAGCDDPPSPSQAIAAASRSTKDPLMVGIVGGRHTAIREPIAEIVTPSRFPLAPGPRPSALLS
jgi:hypothetical protein